MHPCAPPQVINERLYHQAPFATSSTAPIIHTSPSNLPPGETELSFVYHVFQAGIPGPKPPTVHQSPSPLPAMHADCQSPPNNSAATDSSQTLYESGLHSDLQPDGREQNDPPAGAGLIDLRPNSPSTPSSIRRTDFLAVQPLNFHQPEDRTEGRPQSPFRDFVSSPLTSPPDSDDLLEGHEVVWANGDVTSLPTYMRDGSVRTIALCGTRQMLKRLHCKSGPRRIYGATHG